jgi:gag-polypeptide of LTR copia-type
VDAKAHSLIGAHLSDHLLTYFDKYNTTKALWDALKALFAEKTKARRLALQKEMNNVKKDAKESIAGYFARAQRLRDELVGAESDVSDEVLIEHVLVGLPS